MQLTFILPALDDCAPTLIAAATTDRNRDPLKPTVDHMRQSLGSSPCTH